MEYLSYIYICHGNSLIRELLGLETGNIGVACHCSERADLPLPSSFNMFRMSFLLVGKLKHSGEVRVSHSAKSGEPERGGESRSRRPDAEMKAEGCSWRKGVISLRRR